MTTSAVRPRDADVTRNQILSSALELFARENFETVGVRAIGAHARVDPALISRYFGGKDQLFAAVVQRCTKEWRRHWGDAVTLTQRAAVELLDNPPHGAITQGIWVLLRASGSARARQIIEKTSGSTVFEELEDWLGGDDADARARLLFALLAGVAFARSTGGDFALPPGRTAALRTRLTAIVGDLVSCG